MFRFTLSKDSQFLLNPDGISSLAQGCDDIATLGMISAHGFPTPTGFGHSS
jgi:hypothetical protein